MDDLVELIDKVNITLYCNKNQLTWPLLEHSEKTNAFKKFLKD